MANISSVTDADPNEWIYTWRQCEYATYFHSPMWIQLWEQHSGSKIKNATKTVRFEDDAIAIIILTAKQRGGRLISICESSATHGYGGWISTDRLTNAHHVALYKYITQTFPNLIWRVNPFCEMPEYTHRNFQDDYTYAVPLRKPAEDLDAFMTRKKLLTKVRSAQRKGAELRKIDEQHLPDYFRIYTDAQNRWKKKDEHIITYSESVFQQLYHSDNCDFWGVFLDDTLICAGPVLTGPRHAVSWLALADSDYFSVKPFEFFYYHLIHHYKSEGFFWFDFNPSGNRESVDTFKSRFATQRLKTSVWDSRSATLQVLQKARGWLS